MRLDNVALAVVEKLNALDSGDVEDAHALADETLLNFLDLLGYNDVVDAYEDARTRVGFWYS